MTKSNVVDIDVIIVHQTERAVLVKESDGAEGVWLPLSQVEVDTADGVVTLPEWLALEKGLI